MSIQALHKISELQEQLVSGNAELIRLLESMTPEQQKEYATRVQQMIESTNKTIQNVNWLYIPGEKRKGL